MRWPEQLQIIQRDLRWELAKTRPLKERVIDQARNEVTALLPSQPRKVKQEAVEKEDRAARWKEG